MALRVGVDGRGALAERTGMRRYTAGLLTAVAALPGAPVDLTLLAPRSGATADDLAAAGVRVRLAPWWSRLHGVGGRLGRPLPAPLLLGRQDAYLFPAYHRLAGAGRPTVTVIHDLTYRDHPELLNPVYRPALVRAAEEAIRRSDLLVVPSRAVAAALAVRGGRRDDAVLVLPPGPPTWLTAAPPRPERTWAARREPGFLLHVGTLEPRKNLETLLAAMAGLPADLARAHPLVLAGPPGWSDDAVLAAVHRLADRVVHVPAPGDEVLADLYRNAALLVFPTLAEGFGLPVLEAMAAGLPVACSDLPVLREVAGPAAAYFDQRDPEAIAGCVQALLADGTRRSQLRVLGLGRAAEYSWPASAATLARALLELR